jgi:cysteine sulfinate desulfinase/cysteine desulfurase-like protein
LRISLSHRTEREDIDVLIEALSIGLTKLSRMK